MKRNLEHRAEPTDSNLNREILRLSIPNVISNLSVPLMGMADTAIAGHVGSDTAIGALALGTTIFNMVYWNCGFLRMGTSGLTAQSYGRRDFRQSLLLLVRAVALALLIAMPILLLRTPFSSAAVDLMGASPNVSHETLNYVTSRIWAVPAAISLFALNGWFIGMQDARTPMVVAITSNIVNIGASYALAIPLKLGLEGVAWGTVLAQYIGVALSLWVIHRKYAKFLPRLASLTVAECLDRDELKRFFKVNSDIFLRSLCLVATFTLFTSLSSRFGDTVLATNALLMQFFSIYQYMIDGLAYAAESLVGRFVGEGDSARLRSSIRRLLVGGAASSVATSLIFWLFWRQLLSLFSPSDIVMDYAAGYVGWAIALPLACFLAFIADGVMIGATKTRELRNSVAVGALAFIALAFTLMHAIGETALWVSLEAFLVIRGLMLTRPLAKLIGQKRTRDAQ